MVASLTIPRGISTMFIIFSTLSKSASRGKITAVMPFKSLGSWSCFSTRIIRSGIRLLLIAWGFGV